MLIATVAVVALAQLWALQATWHPAPHSGGDNAGYVALAHALQSGQGYTELWDPAAPPHTKYPPVFPALLALAMAFGASTWAGLKVVPLLLGVVAVAATYLWARVRRGPVWGAAVALLTGWSAAFVHHAHYLLSDVPFLAFTLLTLWALEEGRSGVGSEGEAGGGDGPSRRQSRSADAAGVAGGASAAGAEGVAGGAAVAGVVGGVAIALAAAGLAYFTRSAGAPLIVAVLATLVLRRRWVATGVGAVALGVPTALWLLRARGAVGEGAYTREFWMVDPYQPQLGEIGVWGLVPRALDNAGGYLTAHLPAALAGSGRGLAILGLVVGVLALVGWARAARTRLGPAEIFAPLYAALILVWPVVWSGDRFVLPLVPLVVLYAGEALAWLVGRVRPRSVAPVLAMAAGLLLVAEGAAVLRAADESAACRGAVRAGGPWACSGLGMVQFTEAARWVGANLESDAVALTRKPRIWYAMSGRATRTYPFVPYPDSVLAVAGRAGASYVLLDLVGSQAQLLASAIGARPSAFCSVAGFGGRDGGPRTELLGIVPTGAQDAADPSSEEVQIQPCPAALRGRGAETGPYSSASAIPILAGPPSSP